MALNADSNEDREALVMLANLYSEDNDHENYILVLQNIPETNDFFIQANTIIFEFLNSLDISSIPMEKQQDILEQKFRAALNAGREEASYFF